VEFVLRHDNPNPIDEFVLADPFTLDFREVFERFRSLKLMTQERRRESFECRGAASEFTENADG
jgi:hypothetical protein